jgi:predicted peptidase
MLSSLLLAPLAPALMGTSPPRAARGLLFGEIAATPGGARRLSYVLYVPRDYDRARRWPLVLFLHGSGESGTDGVRQLSQGLAPALFEAPDRWPALVLFPQKPESESEWEQYEGALLALVERTRRAWSVDPGRVYLTGLSQGGHGTWVLGARHPWLWAALVPVCGYAGASVGSDDGKAPAGAFDGSADELAAPIAGLPVWAFHGASDSIVPVAQTETLVAALRARGGAPRITVYPGVDHGSWLRAYREEELPRWLFAQRRAPSR